MQRLVTEENESTRKAKKKGKNSKTGHIVEEEEEEAPEEGVRIPVSIGPPSIDGEKDKKGESCVVVDVLANIEIVSCVSLGLKLRI